MSEYKNLLDELNGKNINFLIGAGAPSGLIPTLKSTPLNMSFEDIITNDFFTEEERDVLYFIWFNLWIKKTRVDSIEGSNRSVFDNYYKFTSLLVKLLNNEGFDTPKRVNIFTTNYDSLFELAFDEVSKKNSLTYFNDGSKGFLKKYMSSENYFINATHSGMSDNFRRSIPTINLMKLHGSVTWKKENPSRIAVDLGYEKFEEVVDLSDNIISNLTNLEDDSCAKFLFSENNLVDTLLYNNPGTLTLESLREILREILTEEAESIVEFKESFRQLPVVNPTKHKFNETVFEQHYYQMLRMLSYELEKKNTVLIVFGFSFADEHILEIVRRSMMNPYLKVYIIAYNRDSLRDIDSLLESFPHIEYLPKNRNINVGDFNYLNDLLEGMENHSEY